MRKKIIAATLFFSLSAAAQTPLSPGSLGGNGQNTGAVSSGGAYGGTYGTMTGAPTGGGLGPYLGTGYVGAVFPAESCIKNICGTPNEAKTFMAQYEEKASAFVRLLMSASPEADYPAVVKNLFSELKTLGAKEDEIAFSKIRSAPSAEKVELSGAVNSFYGLGHFGKYLAPLKYKIIQKDGKKQIVVDEEASSAFLKTVPESERRILIEGANYIKANAKKESVSEEQVDSRPSEVNLKQMYPGHSLKNALQLEYKKTKESLAQFKKMSRLEQILYANDTSPEYLASLEQKIANENITENETRAILRWNTNFNSSHLEFSDSENPLTHKYKPSVNEVIEQAGGLEAIISSYKEIRSQSETKKNSQIAECRVRYFLNKGLLPN